MRKKRVLGWLILGCGAAAAASWLPLSRLAPDAMLPGRAAAEKIQKNATPGAAEKRFAALPARDAIGAPAGEIFLPQSWAPPVRAVPAVAVIEKPAPPPMPYRFVGKVLHDGAMHVMLARGDRVLSVRKGETLDDGYRVEAIGSDRITLLYVPLGVRQDLPVSSLLGIDAPLATNGLAPAVPAAQQSSEAAEARPAQLRLEGPQRVKAGSTFEVTLKVTSEQAVRAAPLQLSFDGALLEAVDVRRGDFFADGRFNYRVNPAGSIFIGASGKGKVAADAEFLVVSFKPTGAGGTAELKVSSVILQGAAGTIVHDQPASLRTAIIQ